MLIFISIYLFVCFLSKIENVMVICAQDTSVDIVSGFLHKLVINFSRKWRTKAT